MQWRVCSCRYDEAVDELKKIHEQSSDSKRKAEKSGADRVKTIYWQIISVTQTGRQILYVIHMHKNPVFNVYFLSDLKSKLDAEVAAHKTARERAEQAETQVSMATLDLKTTREEAARLQQEVTGLQQKVRGRGDVILRNHCVMIFKVLVVMNITLTSLPLPQLQALQTESRRRLRSETDSRREQEKRMEELQVTLHHLLLNICSIITSSLLLMS